MPTCFVIQPFNPKFDKRYDGIYKPALEAAGMDPYRVDRDPRTERLIDTIEQEIRNATICLADITTDNPNVWYELGYAFAVDRSVIMVCSKEREDKLPFDIHHRTVIQYSRDSPSDFDKLRDEITTRAKALVKKNAAQQAIEVQQVAPTQDLKPAEVLALEIAAGETTIPGTSVRPWSLREKAIRAGLTGLGLNVAMQGLQRRGFLEIRHGTDENGEYYEDVAVTDSAWTWIDGNDSRFALFKRGMPLTEEDIPF